MIINTAHAGESKKAPVYTYSGQHRLTDQGNGNWLLELLTSGTLTFQELNSFRRAEACGVGGGGSGNSYDRNLGIGGGGGGGGYMASKRDLRLEAGRAYQVTIGDGGLCDVNGNNGDGRPTSISGILTAPGGSQGG